MVQLDKEEIDVINRQFGADLLENVKICADNWSLSSIRLISNTSTNLVFGCDSGKFGPSVLKIGLPSLRKEREWEYLALYEYGGGRFCRAFDADPDRGAILEERIQPGTPLRDERSPELLIFSGVVSGRGWTRILTSLQGHCTMEPLCGNAPARSSMAATTSE